MARANRLHEKEIAYESVEVDVHASAQRSLDFLRLNPLGQMPVLQDDGVTISESIAILEYLEERYPVPALMPTDVVARAQARELMCWSTEDCVEKMDGAAVRGARVRHSHRNLQQ